MDVVPVNSIPTIHAEDKTLTVGDTFNALTEVSASDTEDGDLTNKIEVISSTVDTSKAGTYEVTYKVTDSQGESTTKTIKVTVNAKDVSQTPNTSDHTNILMWLVMSSFLHVLFYLQQ